ncbi:MAG: hypothetical protein IPM57_03460 [Oligoflexia bacterium]|nr:hypothetical protein [Oligoflexia bacterium]
MAAKKKKNQKGFAVLEAVVFLSAFMVLTVYAIDFFTAIHTGVVGSIGARAYLFETLRHRSDINFMRAHSDNPNTSPQYATKDNAFERFHAVTDEDMPLSSDNGLPIVARKLTRNEDEDESPPREIASTRNKEYKRNSIYIKSGYGICTDSRCLKDGG